MKQVKVTGVDISQDTAIVLESADEKTRLLVTCKVEKIVEVVVPPATNFPMNGKTQGIFNEAEPTARLLAASNPTLLRTSGKMCYLGMLGQMDKELFDERRAAQGYEVDGAFADIINREGPEAEAAGRLSAYYAIAVVCHIVGVEAGIPPIIGGSIQIPV